MHTSSTTCSTNTMIKVNHAIIIYIYRIQVAIGNYIDCIVVLVVPCIHIHIICHYIFHLYSYKHAIATHD
jgi:hypothetical protein